MARAINAKRTSGGALVLEGVEVQVQFMDKSRKTIEDLLPKQVDRGHFLLIQNIEVSSITTLKNRLYMCSIL